VTASGASARSRSRVVELLKIAYVGACVIAAILCFDPWGEFEGW